VVTEFYSNTLDSMLLLKAEEKPVVPPPLPPFPDSGEPPPVPPFEDVKETAAPPTEAPAEVPRRYTLKEYLSSIEATSTEQETVADTAEAVYDLDKELSRLRQENSNTTQSQKTYDEELADMEDFDSMLQAMSSTTARARPASTAELSALDSLLDQFSTELTDL
jgi:hypothetical protein